MICDPVGFRRWLSGKDLYVIRTWPLKPIDETRYSYINSRVFSVAVGSVTLDIRWSSPSWSSCWAYQGEASLTKPTATLYCAWLSHVSESSTA